VKRIVLKSAELRDGLYVKPFELLEIEQLWVGRREVWTSTHGRATRYHVMIDGGVSACRKKQNWRNRSVILINEESLIPITSVPAHMCCLRNRCRQIFEAMIQ
jgi:hypothetical protein